MADTTPEGHADDPQTHLDHLISGYSHAPERVFANRLRTLRDAADMTQTQLADRMTRQGFSMQQTTIAKIEAGQRPVRVNEAVAIAGILGLPLTDLLSDPGSTRETEILGTELTELRGQLLEAKAEYETLRARRTQTDLRLRELVTHMNDLEKQEQALRRQWILARNTARNPEPGQEGT